MPSRLGSAGIDVERDRGAEIPKLARVHEARQQGSVAQRGHLHVAGVRCVVGDELAAAIERGAAHANLEELVVRELRRRVACGAVKRL